LKCSSESKSSKDEPSPKIKSFIDPMNLTLSSSIGEAKIKYIQVGIKSLTKQALAMASNAKAFNLK
jgi:hypothetical protein